MMDRKKLDQLDLEQWFFRDLHWVAPEWQVLREADPVQVGCQLLCPDFTLVNAARGLRLCVEIVDYWTPEYLAHKIETLRALQGTECNGWSAWMKVW